MIDRRFRPAFSAGYLLATMLILVPLVEVLANAFPMTPTAARWRYGFIGYLGNNLMLPTLGFAIAVLTAAVLDHGRVLKVMSALGALAGLVMLPALILFGIDAMEVRAAANPSIMRSFDIATAKAGTAMVLSASVLLWAGWTGWRLRPGEQARRSGGGSRDHAARLVGVGAVRESDPGNQAVASQ